MVNECLGESFPVEAIRTREKGDHHTMRLIPSPDLFTDEEVEAGDYVQ